MTSLLRREFLALSTVAAALGITGCQINDPTIVGGPTSAPAPPPGAPTSLPAVPGPDVALVHEVDLGALAGLVHAAAGRLDLGAAQTATAGWMMAAHAMHVTALASPNPAPPAPPAPPSAGDVRPPPRPSADLSLAAASKDAAVDALRARLERALTDHRHNALGSRGPAGLVWGSLGAYAVAARTALASDAPRPGPPVADVRELALWTDAEAMQQALRQVHALVYGYQVAVGVLPRPDSESAYEHLVRRRDLRDLLTRILRERGQAAPAAEPAYALPVEPRDRASAAELIWSMESRFAPFAGAWFATAVGADIRRRALRALEQTVETGIDWGGPLVVWPGWPP